jgi:hypothetical protein
MTLVQNLKNDQTKGFFLSFIGKGVTTGVNYTRGKFAVVLTDW